MKITFLGATKTVTGSNFLVEGAGKKFLVDCGLFQGKATEELENEEPFEFDINSIDFMLLTHAHIDHSGRIPKLYKEGYRNDIIATKATCDLCSIMLPDSGHIQEMEITWQNKKRIRNRVNLFIVLLIVCFFSTYFIVDRLTNSKYKDVSDNQSKTAVYNNTNLLSDDMKIILKVDGVVEKSETLKDFKLDNEIDSVNEQFLVDYYASKGYSVESLSEKKVVLNKNEEEVTVEPNKYYLGEKDGYFAIYKSDENGKVFIEDESDIYRSSGMVNTIPENDQEDIKNFKLGYDTKNEAKEILSGYIS